MAKIGSTLNQTNPKPKKTPTPPIYFFHSPPDVAGATLMAAGSSAPELFAELVGCFVSESNDAGTGTVIGSSIFNQLVIIGGAILLAPFPIIELDSMPLVRDLGFYIWSVILIFVTFQDGKITKTESWVLLLSYVAYVVVMWQWSNIVGKLNERMARKLSGPRDESIMGPNSILQPGPEDTDFKKELRVDHYITDLDAIVDNGGGGNGGARLSSQQQIYKVSERASERTNERKWLQPPTSTTKLTH